MHKEQKVNEQPVFHWTLGTWTRCIGRVNFLCFTRNIRLVANKCHVRGRRKGKRKLRHGEQIGSQVKEWKDDIKLKTRNSKINTFQYIHFVVIYCIKYISCYRFCFSIVWKRFVHLKNWNYYKRESLKIYIILIYIHTNKHVYR